MSRRLRIEEEKAKQLKDEMQDEEDMMKLLQKKIFGPLVWRTFQNGIRIEDIQEHSFNEVIDLVMAFYINQDVLFRNTKIEEDPVSQKCFAERLFFKLRDRASIMAIDEKNDNCLAGILILNPVQKSEFARVYSRAMLVEGNSYRSIADFLNHINRKVDVFERFQCDRYLRYYLLCIRPEYRGRALGFNLMLVGLDVARHLKIPVVTGVFTSFRMQKIGTKVGIGEVLFEYPYTKWADKNAELVFCDPGAGNYTCNIQAGLVPPPPPEPETTHVPEDKDSNAKATRADKRKAKAKADAKKK